MSCMEMTPARWEYTKKYLHETFGRPDEQLATLMHRAVAAGLPDIAVSADVGRLLELLAAMVCREQGAKGRALELGTLAGYSGIWLARGMGRGELITVESEPKHADFAATEFDRAGVGQQVRIVTGAALDVLPGLATELGPESLDLAFFDAIKTEYTDYLRLVRPLLRPGGLLIADNALGSGHWWIDCEADETRRAVDTFNRAVAADPVFTAACVPAREGVLIARKA